jgi:hypothetical protein
MLGQLWQIPEVHAQVRVHGANTVRKPWSELVKWFDPSAVSSRRPLYPELRLGLEYARSVNRLDLGAADRVLCHLAAGTIWHARVGRNVVGAYKRKLKELCSTRLDVSHND